MSISKQIAEWKEKKFGRVMTEEELIMRADPVWPYLHYKPGPYIEPSRIDECMKGAVELHTHGAPTAWLEGRANYFDTSLDCSRAGMKAVVFKDQDCPTVAMAGVAQRGLDAYCEERAKQGEEINPISVYGGVVLDNSIGGMNLHAVEKALSFNGNRCKEIWLPCWDSAHLQEIFGDETKGIRVSDMRGTLTDDMIKLLDILAQYNDNSEGNTCALATCHVSNEEKYDITKYVHDKGMKVPVVHDHITQEMTLNTPEEAIELIKLGSYVEICSNSVVPWVAMTNWIVTYDYCVNLVKTLVKECGPEKICLITDAGLPDFNEVPALRALISVLLKNGISDEDVKYMAGIAPSTAIGI